MIKKPDWEISETKHSVYFYQNSTEPFIFDAVSLPNKQEFFDLYKTIPRKKTWIRILYLLAWFYGVKWTYQELQHVTKTEVESYLKENKLLYSPPSFGKRFKQREFDYQQELENLVEVHFSREPMLISKDGERIPKRSVEHQLLQQVDPYCEFSESITFLRYHLVLHHLLIYDDIQLTSEMYNISIPSLYRVQKQVQFEFDVDSFPLEAALLDLEVKN